MVTTAPPFALPYVAFALASTTRSSAIASGTRFEPVKVVYAVRCCPRPRGCSCSLLAVAADGHHTLDERVALDGIVAGQAGRIGINRAWLEKRASTKRSSAHSAEYFGSPVFEREFPSVASVVLRVRMIVLFHSDDCLRPYFQRSVCLGGLVDLKWKSSEFLWVENPFASMVTV